MPSRSRCLPALRALKIGGLGLEGYGCRGGSTLLDGFVQMEMARVDASFSTFFGVHNGLAMGSIYLGGSERTEAGVVAAAGPAGKDRLLRPHRALSGFRNLVVG